MLPLRVLTYLLTYLLTGIELVIKFKVILSDSTVFRMDTFQLLQTVLVNVKGLYGRSKFIGNAKLLMYGELQCEFIGLRQSSVMVNICGVQSLSLIHISEPTRPY